MLLPFRICTGVAVLAAGLGIGAWGQIGSAVPANVSNGAASATAAIPSTVLGQVINAVTGMPVPRALVRLNERAMLTDHDGKFRFEQNTAASANVLVSKPGFSATTEMQEGGNVYLQGAQLGATLELRLYPEAVLTGTVVGPDGTGLPHIPVSAMRSIYDDSGHRWVTVGQDQTDSHGNFRLPEQAGEYRLETRYVPLDRTTGQAVLPVMVPGEGSTDTSQVIRAHAGEELHFELRPAVSPTHTVWVMVEGGGGRDFVRITARSSNGSTLQVNPQMSEGGEMRIQLPQGTYTLTARRNNPDNPEQAETTVTVPDHDISGVTLAFAPIPSIPVEMIVDSSATSDNNAQVPTLPQLGLVLESAQMDPDRGDSTVRPTTRRDQSFVFTAPPGSYRLQGRNTGGSWYIKSATYGDADLLTQEMVVAPGAAGTPIRVVVSNQTGSLQGTVSLNGTAGSYWVYMIPTGPTVQPVIGLRSGSSGGYVSGHLPPGSYQAIAFERKHSANYRDAASLAPYASHVRSVTVNAGDKPTLNLEAVPVAEVVP